LEESKGGHVLNKKMLKENKVVRNIYRFIKSGEILLSVKLIVLIKQYMWFLKELKKFHGHSKNLNFKKTELYPCLTDNLKSTPLEPTYFFQDSWAAKHIFNLKPAHHYDVGSSAQTMGILSQFTPVTMVDIRPVELELENFFFKKGSILDLPFEDNTLETLSSLCVIEHIGLGRYGDELDPFGSEKAIKELKRVLRMGGVILFSVPVDSVNTIYFNAHRAFTRDYILELFAGYKILEEKYHYGMKMFDCYDAKKGFGTGLFMLEKK